MLNRHPNFPSLPRDVLHNFNVAVGTFPEECDDGAKWFIAEKWKKVFVDFNRYAGGDTIGDADCTRKQKNGDIFLGYLVCVDQEFDIPTFGIPGKCMIQVKDRIRNPLLLS